MLLKNCHLLWMSYERTSKNCSNVQKPNIDVRKNGRMWNSKSSNIMGKKLWKVSAFEKKKHFLRRKNNLCMHFFFATCTFAITPIWRQCVPANDWIASVLAIFATFMYIRSILHYNVLRWYFAYIRVGTKKLTFYFICQKNKSVIGYVMYRNILFQVMK